jgi:hypothetical protein
MVTHAKPRSAVPGKGAVWLRGRAVRFAEALDKASARLSRQVSEFETVTTLLRDSYVGYVKLVALSGAAVPEQNAASSLRDGVIAAKTGAESFRMGVLYLQQGRVSQRLSESAARLIIVIDRLLLVYTQLVSSLDSALSMDEPGL